MQRRLVVVLAADVANYSHLMGKDSVGTLAALKKFRNDQLEPIVAAHNGLVVKRMGDGWLIEFTSAADAVSGAMRIQEGLATNPVIKLRIGIHIGDITHDDDDMFGDGINIASRLQAVSQPGGIVISEFLRRSIDEKLAAAFVDLGRLNLKNIAQPVAAFGWGMAAVVNPVPMTIPDKPSIVVLPFSNMSGDPEQQYFSDGMTDDIITDLSKASGLFVIARNSSFAFRGQSPDARQVCAQLGVRYLLEGSVRRVGDRVRVNAQLIDGFEGGQIWADRYDRDLEDIFAVQDDLTREIVGALRVRLTKSEESRREGKGKIDPEAYDYLYLGRAQLWKFDAKSNREARQSVERAIEIDPNFARAHSLLSIILHVDHLNDWNQSNADSLERALRLAERGRELDPNDAISFVALSMCQMRLGDLKQAEIAAKQAIELDPNNAHGFSVLGNVLDFGGHHEWAVESLMRACRLDPEVDFFLSQLGRALFAASRYEEAERVFKRRLLRNPGSDTTRAYLAALYGLQGRIAEARDMWRDLFQVNPDFDPEISRKTLPYSDSNWFDQYYGGLKKAGLYQ